MSADDVGSKYAYWGECPEGLGRQPRKRCHAPLIVLSAVAASLLVGCTLSDGTGTPSPGTRAGTLAPATVSPAGSGGSITPAPVDGRLFAHVLGDSAGMTVAVDPTGMIHVAAVASVRGTNDLVYGHCAGGCGEPGSWQFVRLATGAGTSHVPTIALTNDAHPRIVFEVFGSGYAYLECDAGCDKGSGWHLAQMRARSSRTNSGCRHRSRRPLMWHERTPRLTLSHGC
jgi:hypothetical protein